MIVRTVRIVFQFFYTIWLWTLCLVFFTAHFVLSLVFPWFFKDPHEINQRMTIPFIRTGYFLLGIRLRVTGRSHLPKGPFVLVCNHQSHLDILSLLAVLRRKISFIAKKELAYVPILGWDIRLQGHFFVDRKNSKVAAKQLEAIRKKVEAGNPVLFFPEGTRSADRQIGPFKRGAFLLAAQTGVPVVPCYLEGANQILNKKSFLTRPAAIRIQFGEPIRGTEPETLMRQARESILRMRDQ